MSFKSYIDNYMQENGSTDPVAHEKAKHACGAHIAAALKASPTTQTVARPGELETTLGGVYNYLGLPDEAVDYFDAALKITPGVANIVVAKIQALLKKPDKAPAVACIEAALAADDLMANPGVALNLRIFHLMALSEANQYNSASYARTMNYMLEHHPENIYSHVYAGRYYDANDEKIKFLQHLQKIVELTRDNEAVNGALGYHPEALGVIAKATQLAIRYRDKKKTWLFIAHLMNSTHDPAEILILRQAAMEAFPSAQKNTPNHQR